VPEFRRVGATTCKFAELLRVLALSGCNRAPPLELNDKFCRAIPFFSLDRRSPRILNWTAELAAHPTLIPSSAHDATRRLTTTNLHEPPAGRCTTLRNRAGMGTTSAVVKGVSQVSLFAFPL
jgi:hypothetical protein